MGGDEIKDLLWQLRDALDDPDAVDGSSRELLIQVRDDIEEYLELSSESQIRRTLSLRERLVEAVESFQQTHPGLTRAMGNLAETLAGLGI